MKSFNYENKEYLGSLNNLGYGYYSTYVRLIKKYLPKKSSRFLDVGCGNGSALEILKKDGFKNGYGVDISRLFVQEAKKKNITNVFYYSGGTLPFKKEKFDLVGSFNVLEHTKNPEEFIKNQLEVVKPKGILVIICPNFLSSVLFNNWHPRLKGGKQKLRNILAVANKLCGNNKFFEITEPIKTRKFKYDSDAIAMTNLIDIKRTINKLNCNILYESGFINTYNVMTQLMDSISLLRYMSPSCVIVVRKK